MPMYQFRHPGMERDVRLTPEPDLGSHVGCVMNVALLGTYYRPSALSIDASNMGRDRRIVSSGARAVGHLVEAVTGSYGADFYRFK